MLSYSDACRFDRAGAAIRAGGAAVPSPPRAARGRSPFWRRSPPATPGPARRRRRPPATPSPASSRASAWSSASTSGEARLLLPGGDRVTLYQIAAASGVRYTNGLLELRGKGMELQLVRDGTAATLEGCQPYVVPQ